jgi:hypothetical protein
MRFATALVVIALLPLAAPQPAHAQFGGLIKKKVKEAIKGPEKPQGDEKPKAAESKPGRPTVGPNSDVFELTEPVFAGVTRGLETELRLQSEFRAELAKWPTQEQYNQCMVKVAQSPDYMKILETAGKLPSNATPEQAVAAQQKMQSDLDALAKRICPINPVNIEWPNWRRMERLEEIRVKAADSAGRDTLSGDTVSIASSAGWTVRQYALAIERIERLCDYNSSSASSPAGSGVNNPAIGDSLMIKGIGTNIFWVFTSRETRVLNSASCRRLRDLNKGLMS